MQLLVIEIIGSAKLEILDSTKIDVITIKDITKDSNLLKIKGSRCGTKSYTYTFEITPKLKKYYFMH